MSNKPILFNMPPSELEQFVVGLGQPRFRAKQVQEWLYRGAPDFSVMKNLPESLRRDLGRAAQTLPCTIEQKLESLDRQTTKFLLRTTDTNQQHDIIETVLMRTSYGNSVCVSSQAGCAMGCKFCASTLLGLKRNLTANEMLAQVLAAQWELRTRLAPHDAHKVRANGDPNNNDVSHIVVMGTGEPLQNTENLRGFLETANAKLGISWRRMTVSTCGIVPGINELTEWARPVNLAISLHAPNDELRGELMPINKRYPIADVLDAAFAHSERTGRQLMIEYILLDFPTPNRGTGGGNYAPEHAEQLSPLLKHKSVMVNLIPWNAVAERGDLSAPSNNAVHRFQDILKENGIHTRIRRERGADIGSACGQLRLNPQPL
ncbi:MAG: 23S rRNA (adenine(2503)-C(2))-methyltransferase RlmN [Alphaproteobacteria bacterium]|nr:23S rRNA (adenine(2503)-C(2))-methyltransferase RlmN [Alphaproteobacteria bacterium]